MYKKRNLYIGSSLYGHKYTKATMDDYYSKSDCYIEGQVGFQKRFKTDIIPLPVYIVGEALQFGVSQKVKKMTAPTIWNYADEVKEVKLDDELDITASYYEYIFACSQGLKSLYPDKQRLAFISSPVDYGIMVFGLPKWIELLLFEEDLYFTWLKKFVDYHNKYKKALIDHGVRIIVVSNVFMNNKIINIKLIKDKIIPFLNKYLDKEIPSMIHSTFMPLYATLNCLEGLETGSGYAINESDSIQDIQTCISKDKWILGNIGSDQLYRKNEELIRHKTMELLMATGDTDKFILATVGADLNVKTTHQQIQAIYKGVEDYERNCK